MSSITLLNYFMEPPKEMVLTLNPLMDAVENAEEYFSKARKAKRGIPVLEQKIQEEQARLSQLEKDQTVIESAEEKQALPSLLQNYANREPKNAHHPEKKKTADGKGTSIKKIILENGDILYIGRNARENIHLYKRVAKGNDLWFHCRDYPGGHIYLHPAHADQIDTTTLIKCANLAAHYSKLKGENGVEILYTYRKHLSRKPNLPPGTLFHANAKTIMIDYDKQIIKSLLEDKIPGLE